MDFITGSSGFIGRHLSYRLPKAVRVKHYDIPLLNPGNFNRIFFLSSYGNMYYQFLARDTIKANILDPIGLLGKVVPNDFNSFVYVSSSSAGLKHKTLYAHAKATTEKFIESMNELYNKPICAVRPFSITGVGEQKEHLIPTLIRAAYSGEEVPFSPEPVHDYVDVNDFVNALMVISEAKYQGIIEVGTGTPVSNQTVLDLIQEATGKQINTKLTENLRSYDNTDWFCKSKKIFELGWTPNKSLKQTITEMVEDYQTMTAGV